MAGSGGARTLEQTLFFTVLLLSSCSFRRVCVCVCVCVCVFLGLNPRHMKVSRLGVELKL